MDSDKVEQPNLDDIDKAYENWPGYVLHRDDERWGPMKQTFEAGYRTGFAAAAHAPTPAPPPTYPIQLNTEQEKCVQIWAADERCWTKNEREFNLRTFARKIIGESLRASAPPPSSTAFLTERRDWAQRMMEKCLGPSSSYYHGFSAAYSEMLARESKKPAERKIDGKFSMKYGVSGGQIVNTVSGEVIPEDEPLFLIRGRDNNAVAAITSYMNICKKRDCNNLHLAGIEQTLEKFETFAIEHPERMKQPGITKHLKLEDESKKPTTWLHPPNVVEGKLPPVVPSTIEKAHEGARFPIGKCKKCGKNVWDERQDGKTILFCSYECYCNN